MHFTCYEKAMASIVIVKTTLPSTWSEDEVNEFSSILVESKNAACVQSKPIKSTYHWKGKIETDDEWELDIKTSKINLPELLKLINENHPYQIPQLVWNNVETSGEFSDWIDSETSH